MSEPSKKAYVGSYGVFLDTVNEPEMPLKPVVMDLLNNHGGHMKITDLITAVDAPALVLMNTVNTLQSQHIISITRQNNDEIVDIL